MKSVIDRKDGFLKDIIDVSKKHNIVLWGCGCCGGPTMVDHNNAEKRSNYCLGDDLGKAVVDNICYE
jgi:hypothetical protein